MRQQPTLGKMEKSVGVQGPGHRSLVLAFASPCPSVGLSLFICEVKTGLGDRGSCRPHTPITLSS